MYDYQKQMHTTGKGDQTPLYHHWEPGKYQFACHSCYLGHAHSEAVHAENVANCESWTGRKHEPGTKCGDCGTITPALEIIEEAMLDEQPTIDEIAWDDESEEHRQARLQFQAKLSAMSIDEYNEWLDQQTEESAVRYDARGGRW